MRVLAELVQVLLRALLPLLERRTLAAERQAAATEQQYLLLRQYLGYSDPEFHRILQGELTQAQEDAAAPVDVDFDEGHARDQKLARLEELRVLWFQQHGELLSDERLMEEYDRLYEERAAVLDADQTAGVARSGAPSSVR